MAAILRATKMEDKIGAIRLIFTILPLALLLVSCGGTDQRPELRIAVASNFKTPATELVKIFQDRTGENITITAGSTGKLFAQIRNGAPYDVFLAADRARPELLESEGPAAAGSRFTYALGKLVLWSPQEIGTNSGPEFLEKGEFEKLAIANPKLAPFGKAAEEVLRNLGIWERFEARLVRGEDIGQTFQFVSTGNADAGFVALSQVKGKTGSFWEVPQELYSPIEQQAVLLKDTDAGRGFLRFLDSEEGKKVIRKFGYDTR